MLYAVMQSARRAAFLCVPIRCARSFEILAEDQIRIDHQPDARMATCPKLPEGPRCSPLSRE